MSERFVVKTEQFEGPLELLLSLIEKRKLFINDISLAQIADDYLNHINELGSISLKDISEFLVIASTLILIKSKSLLPNLDLTAEEEESIEDLQHRLAVYKEIKELSTYIKDKFGMNIMWSASDKAPEPVFGPSDDITLKSIEESILDVIGDLPVLVVKDHPRASVKKVISLEEMIGDLKSRVESSLKTTFKDFSNTVSKGEKVNAIVSFLAILELFKVGLIELSQTEVFGDIYIESKDIGVPRYN